MIHRGAQALERRRGRATALVAVLVLVILSSTYVAARATGDRPDRCERFAAASATRAGLVAGAGADVLVIGDSYSAGLLLDEPAASWPSRLDGRVRVAAFSGSGFSRGASPCGDVSFATRAAQALGPDSDSDLVVVQGGLNDTDQPAAAVRAGFERLVRAVGDRPLVVVGPPSALRRTALVPAVEDLLRALCDRHGVPYVSTTDLDLAYLDDGLHLTEGGHREFGDVVAGRLAGQFPR